MSTVRERSVGHQNIYVIGDMESLSDAIGSEEETITASLRRAAAHIIEGAYSTQCEEFNPYIVFLGRVTNVVPSLHPRVEGGIASPAPAQNRAIALLQSWANASQEEQTDTWTYLRRALDEDRISNRRLFP